MPVPPGVFSAVGVGSPAAEFRVHSGVYQVGTHIVNTTIPATTTQRAGSLMTYDTVSPAVIAATSSAVLCAGILGDNVFAPLAIPADLANNIFGVTLLKWAPVGRPVTIWKKGEYFVTNVSGSVSYKSFIVPATVSTVGGFFGDNAGTNVFLNGCVICLTPNAVSAGPIVVLLDVI